MSYPRPSLFILALAAGVLAGCASRLPNNQFSEVSGRLVYATVSETEVCGESVSPSKLGDRALYGFAGAPLSETLPYRVAKARFSSASVGESFASSLPMPFQMLAYVPDGTPKLESGDEILVRMGDGAYTYGFDYKHPAPQTGLSNVVVADFGRNPANLPEVGYHQSPWVRMPWAQSVQHYGLSFTPYWRFDTASGKCEPTRALAPADSRRTSLPTWPRRTSD